MRVALAQLDARLGEVEANEARAREAVAEARAAGADLVVFPELFLSGYALAATSGGTERRAQALAPLADGAAVVLGFHEAGGHDSAAYLDGTGVLHVQRKVCLVDYPPFDEHRVFAPGAELRAFDTPHGRFATLICNDAWQPFLPALAAHDGARVLLVPAASSDAVPEAEAYWRDLTRFYARLLECYVVFANRVGTEEGLTFWGGSHVVDPLGRLVVEAPRLEEALVVADVHVERVDERRRQLPLVRDARLDVLRAELDRLVRKA